MAKKKATANGCLSFMEDILTNGRRGNITKSATDRFLNIANKISPLVKNNVPFLETTQKDIEDMCKELFYDRFTRIAGCWLAHKKERAIKSLSHLRAYSLYYM